MCMVHNRIYTILIGLTFFLTTCFSQTTAFQKIDGELTNSFKAMVSASPPLRDDSLGTTFKTQLLSYLINPVTFNNVFDSLSKYLTITTSPDKKVIFYSWDDMSGGTWHHIHCVAQFQSDQGRIMIQQINSGKEAETGDYTDSRIYEVFELGTDKEKLYLTLAWGTHGSGYEHRIVQIFRIQENVFQKCGSCFTDTRDLVIEYPRGEKADLVFDPMKNQIRYKEFRFDEETGLAQPTGEIITFELRNGETIFEKINNSH